MNVTLALGLLLVVGLVGGSAAVRMGLPSVTGYILMGLLVGPSLLGLITQDAIEALEPLHVIALGVVSMTIGGELRLGFFRRLARELVPPFLGEVVLTFSLVAGTTYLVTGSPAFGVLLGVVGTSTAPSAILSIIREEEGPPGRFSRSLLALVALDSLFCIVAFGIVVGLGALWIDGADVSLLAPLGDILMSLGLGGALGLALGTMSMRQLSDERLMVLSLGLLITSVGLGHAAGLSPLLIAMTAGIVLTNMPTRAWRPFAALRTIEMPVLVAFLTLAGTRMDVSQLAAMGPLAAAYILVRVAGKVGGTFLGSLASPVPKSYRWNLGLGLTPQAGVAVGLAVFAETELPYAAGLTTLVLSAVIVLELFAPPIVRRALRTADTGVALEQESVGAG